MSKMISFIIPAHNEEEQIERCLKSILDQNTTDIEVLLIDDASTDDTFRIMKSYSEKYPFIKVFHEDTNHGQSHARNIGLEHAEGEYIWFVDADDHIAEGAVKILEEAVEKDNPECVYFYWQREMDDYVHDTPQRIELQDISPDKAFSGRELFSLMAERLPRLPDSVWRFIVKREFVEKEGLRFLEGAVYEDGIFGIEIYLKAKRVKQIRDICYVYTNNLSSTGHRSNRVFYYACSFIKYFFFIKKGMENIRDDDDFLKIYSKVLREVYFHSKELYNKLNADDDPLPIIERISRKAAMLYVSMYGSTEDQFKGNEKLNELLMSGGDIVVYGAGKKARELAVYLDGFDKRILAYVVSDEYFGEKRPTNPKTIYGVPVIALSSAYDLPKEVTVICTTRKVHEDRIRENLNKAGFDRLFFINGQ